MGAGYHGGFGNTKGKEYIYNKLNDKNDLTPNDSNFHQNVNLGNPNTKIKVYKQKFNINDLVKTLVDKGEFVKGTIGFISKLWNNIKLCEVSFLDETEVLIGSEIYSFKEIEKI